MGILEFSFIALLKLIIAVLKFCRAKLVEPKILSSSIESWYRDANCFSFYKILEIRLDDIGE